MSCCRAHFTPSGLGAESPTSVSVAPGFSSEDLLSKSASGHFPWGVREHSGAPRVTVPCTTNLLKSSVTRPPGRRLLTLYCFYGAYTKWEGFLTFSFPCSLSISWSLESLLWRTAQAPTPPRKRPMWGLATSACPPALGQPVFWVPGSAPQGACWGWQEGGMSMTADDPEEGRESKVDWSGNDEDE